MDFGQLRLFQSVVDLGSFTRAARRLPLSQPAISLQIKRLEAEIGTPLFERHGRGGIRLTAAGQVVYAFSTRVLGLAGEMAGSLDALQRGRAGSLRVGANLTVHAYVLPPVLHRFQARHPGVRIEIVGGHVGQMIDELERGLIDLAIVWGPVDAVHLDATHVGDDELLPVALPTHPLVRRKGVSPAELAAQPVLLNSQNSSTRAFLERQLQDAGGPPQRPVEFGTPAAIKEAVLAGIGIGFLSPYAVHREIEAGQLACIRVPGLSLRRRLYCVQRHGGTLPAAAGRLVLDLTQFMGRHGCVTDTDTDPEAGAPVPMAGGG